MQELNTSVRLIRTAQDMPLLNLSNVLMTGVLNYC